MGEETNSEIIEYKPGKEFLDFMNKNPESSHSYLHMTWAKILSGVETSWTLEDLYRLHKVVLSIMDSSGIKHISNIDTLDTTETLSEIVNLASELSPYSNFTKLMSENVEKAHSFLHKVWNRILNGKYVDWNLEEIYRSHKMVVGDMLTSGIKHVSNVDTLDTTETLSKIEELQSSSSPNSLTNILKHLVKSSFENPIAFLLEDKSEKKKIKVYLAHNEDRVFDRIIKERICEILPKSCSGKIDFIREKKKGIDMIPILSFDDILKTKLVESMSVHLKPKKKVKKKVKKLSEDRIMKKIYELTQQKISRKDIAESVNLSKSTVYLKQKEIGLQ